LVNLNLKDMEQSAFFSDQDPLSGEHMPDGNLRIKIFGLGGAGTNAVDRIKLDDLEQVHLSVMDTDSQVLASSPVEESLLLGVTVTNGKSAGGSAEKGRMAAEADREVLQRAVKGVDLVFILVGLGGGTGSGAAPVLAELASQEGALVIAFATLPFKREGTSRQKRATLALESLQEHCHAVITLPNDVIFHQVDENATLMEAFALADKWIKMGVHSIWSMLFNTGLINVDFSTLQSALAGPGGKALFGTGYGSGEQFVDAALQDLDMCPLLHVPEPGALKDSDQLIVHLTGGPDLTMAMVNQVMDAVASKFGSRVSLLMGASIDGSFYSQVRITLLGTLHPVSAKKGFAPVPAASIPPNEPVAPPLKKARSDPPLPAAPEAVFIKQQEEFAFPSETDARGTFERTGKNLYEGVDLDIPTYLRRGVKLSRN